MSRILFHANIAITTAAVLAGGLSSAPGQVIFQRLKSFGFPDRSSAHPAGSLIEGSDGMLYGASGGGSNRQGTVYRLNKDGTGFAIIKTFANNGADGQSPTAALIEANNGMLYGVTWRGGSYDRGTVYRINRDGADFAVLRSFTGTNGDGYYPATTLLQGNDGKLYGVTAFGGAHNQGTIFKLNADGSGYALLQSLSGADSDGNSNHSPLVQGTNSVLYGVIMYGGTNRVGAVFKLNPDGSGFAVIKNFDRIIGNGPLPEGALVIGTNGALYGITTFGGTHDQGTIFKLNPDGSGFEVLRNFTGTNGDGGYVRAGLAQDNDGNLYGVTLFGGGNSSPTYPSGSGTVFRFQPTSGSYAVLKGFTPTGGQAAFPSYRLTPASDGNLYGVTGDTGSSGNGTVFKLGTDGSNYAVLWNFTGTGRDAAIPMAALVLATNDVLYGTANYGGDYNLGALFKVNQDGSGYAILRSFIGPPMDGGDVESPLIQGRDGALYGTSVWGSNYLGALFRINPDGSDYRIIKTFTNAISDGAVPRAPVMQARDGVLYGTLEQGGTNNLGAVFKINPDGSGYSVLKKFTGLSGDAARPGAALVQGSDGALYGTTVKGGISNLGTVYRLNTDATEFRVLKSFTGNASDGASPFTPLIEGNDGLLYGTTDFGGSVDGGTVFKLNRDGSGFVLLRSLGSMGVGGYRPLSGLVQAKNGTLYGTTYESASPFRGTVFQLNPDGSGYAVLNRFGAQPGDGAFPQAALVQSSDGSLFGTTTQGGDMGYGIVFRLVPPAVMLPPALLPDAVQIQFNGNPGRAYTLQKAPRVFGPWTSLTNLTLDVTGSARVIDPRQATGEAYYRTVTAHP